MFGYAMQNAVVQLSLIYPADRGLVVNVISYLQHHHSELPGEGRE